MESFDELNISKQLQYAVADLGFEKPTPIQAQSFSVIMSGTDMVGIAQTGTGKTFAYMLPILQDLKFSKQVHPRVMVLVPTRELVLQVVEEIEKFGKYSSIRVVGIYGGTNINNQKEAVAQGTDILVATPGRLYDLIISRAIQLKSIKKVVIDEVDVMLDLGFRFQLTNILELLPTKRQNIMFSATMTDDVNVFIHDFFIAPATVSVAVSGTPLENISQFAYAVPNFYTKANLLKELLQNEDDFKKVLVFVPNKKHADLLFDILDEFFGSEVAVIHSNKTQNYRIRSIENFNAEKTRILVTTDVMARGLDLDRISHVINYDTPNFPENYMHRIGRTGRAEQEGTSILFYTEKEAEAKEAIEALMDLKLEELAFPIEVEISKELTFEEQPQVIEINNPGNVDEVGPAFHDKKEKNRKENQGGSYKRIIKQKYKKPKTRGDKNYNKKKKR
ncbi:DNA/RNA helicase, superfamily II [Aequorivita sublithincola DSM 14238]|uniref:DNA/RNA helicase, superfamily II n=1 Tax=Aequorivita sublithincola (strain DSM 14238 / LMG 21431 / ACAM 643 / 9-3) TaxID=746697 RepID=I3YXX5_AEQSU|nr:DEAD/DEAH box helicase [Aequorivita sublithincola]AFL81843.1 DNA/RNA helicase, superfamily II [Aequorivita sublithincola DSM 14238]